MSVPFPAVQVVECYRDRAWPDDADQPEAPFWTRLQVPTGLPVFAGDRPWAEAVMAHFNPLSGRCFVVALAKEDMIEPFLARFPDGIGTGTPSDESFAAEMSPIAVISASMLGRVGCKVLNELPDRKSPHPAPEGPSAV